MRERQDNTAKKRGQRQQKLTQESAPENHQNLRENYRLRQQKTAPENDKNLHEKQIRIYTEE